MRTDEWVGPQEPRLRQPACVDDGGSHLTNRVAGDKGAAR